jgi:hypothetical protein
MHLKRLMLGLLAVTATGVIYPTQEDRYQWYSDGKIIRQFRARAKTTAASSTVTVGANLVGNLF